MKVNLNLFGTWEKHVVLIYMNSLIRRWEGLRAFHAWEKYENLGHCKFPQVELLRRKISVPPLFDYAQGWSIYVQACSPCSVNHKEHLWHLSDMSQHRRGAQPLPWGPCINKDSISRVMRLSLCASPSLFPCCHQGKRQTQVGKHRTMHEWT